MKPKKEYKEQYKDIQDGEIKEKDNGISLETIDSKEALKRIKPISLHNMEE